MARLGGEIAYLPGQGGAAFRLRLPGHRLHHPVREIAHQPLQAVRLQVEERRNRHDDRPFPADPRGILQCNPGQRALPQDIPDLIEGGQIAAALVGCELGPGPITFGGQQDQEDHGYEGSHQPPSAPVAAVAWHL